MQSFDIFFSHAGEDKETIALPLYERLCKRGISVFFDIESFRLGDHCPKVMDHAMQTAPVGIFIMSPEFVAKGWPMRELICFVKRYDRAAAAEMTLPLLIPVFYRLGTRDCRGSAIFDTYSSLFRQHRLFERATEGTVPLKEVSHALDTAATVWSIENDTGASNLDRPNMKPTRESFIEMIQNRILERLREEKPDLVDKYRPVEDAQPKHQDEYRRCNMVPSNPPRLTLDYDSPTTCEGRLRTKVLGESRSQLVAVIASGKGGVGKTCALRGLAKDDKIKKAFPGGILYIQLGNDAGTTDLVKGIAKIVDRTGGSNAKKEIQAAETVQEACERASKWFDSRVCLFLIDDIWKVHGIDSKVLSTLGLMMNESSRMVCTTRDEHFLRRANEVIEFKEREALGDLSRQMLLTHAGISEDTKLDHKNEVALKYFLTLCQGLPLGFGIVGGSVWDYSRQCPNKQDALSEFYSEVSSNQKNLMDAEADDYGRLSNIVDLSLQVLEKRNVDVKYDHRFRALSVLQKQQSVPAQMLQKLWDLDTLRRTINIVESFANVSVVQMTRNDGFVFVQLHDLMLDIAVERAAEETQGFFQQLVRNYISSNRMHVRDDRLRSTRRGADEEQMVHALESQPAVERSVEAVVRGETEQATARLAFCQAWWNTEDDGYIHDNLCRLLRRAGYVEELLWLLSQPLWIVKRLVDGGIFGVEQDLEHGQTMARNVSQHAFREENLRIVLGVTRMWASFARLLKYCTFGVEQEVRHGRAVGDSNASRHADRKEHLKMIGIAARMSASFVNQNPREVWFQLHGRLLWHATRSELTRDFVKRMEMCAPKPWLKASMGFLLQAGCGALEVVNGPGIVLCTRVEGDEIWILWRIGYKLHVGKYDRTYNRHEHEELARGEEMGKVEEASFLPDQRSVVTAHEDGNIRVWNRQTVACQQVIPHECKNHQRYIQFYADGARVACRTVDHSIRLWDTLSGKSVGRPLQGHTDTVGCVAVSADGSRIVSGSDDDTVRVWDARSGNAVGQPLRGHTAAVVCVAVSADGSRIASGSDDKTVRVWDARSGNAVGQPLRGHTDTVWCVAVSADGSRIVSGSDDKTVRVWDARSGNAVGQPLRGHTDTVHCVAVSADGSRIVSGSDDDTVRVWDARSGNAVGQPLRGHTAAVVCVAVSADGSRIASGSDDKTVRVWDARSGNAVGQPLQGHVDTVCDVAVSADGSRVVSEDFEMGRLWVLNAGGGECVLTSRDAAWERTIHSLALTWSSRGRWDPEMMHVGADDGSEAVLGTCERAVQNIDGGDVYFDNRFGGSCHIVRPVHGSSPTR